MGTFTKRKVARSGANSPDNQVLDKFLEQKYDLKQQNKLDRKKAKNFFFSENTNKTTSEKQKLSIDKISANRISKSSHNHCTCHLTGDDEILGDWYQNKNLEHSRSNKTKIDEKRMDKTIKKLRKQKMFFFPPQLKKKKKKKKKS